MAQERVNAQAATSTPQQRPAAATGQAASAAAAPTAKRSRLEELLASDSDSDDGGITGQLAAPTPRQTPPAATAAPAASSAPAPAALVAQSVPAQQSTSPQRVIEAGSGRASAPPLDICDSSSDSEEVGLVRRADSRACPKCKKDLVWICESYPGGAVASRKETCDRCGDETWSNHGCVEHRYNLYLGCYRHSKDNIAATELSAKPVK